MAVHAEILTARQRQVLRLLGPRAAEEGYYLAGGTAIALHLGHRRSVDFDWFLEGRMGDPLRLAADLQASGTPFHTGQVAKGTLYGTLRGVRVSFFEFRYRMLDPLVAWPEIPCRLAGLRDLACMKLSAIAQRGSKKDFVDLYALERSGFSLAAMLDGYREKFAVEDIAHVLYALAYFDDADRERMPRMVWKMEWREVKRVIAGWVRGA